MSWMWMAVAGAFFLGMMLGIVLMGLLAAAHQE
jgi:hypothetical protein